MFRGLSPSARVAGLALIWGSFNLAPFNLSTTSLTQWPLFQPCWLIHSIIHRLNDPSFYLVHNAVLQSPRPSLETVLLLSSCVYCEDHTELRKGQKGFLILAHSKRTTMAGKHSRLSADFPSTSALCGYRIPTLKSYLHLTSYLWVKFDSINLLQTLKVGSG